MVRLLNIDTFILYGTIIDDIIPHPTGWWSCGDQLWVRLRLYVRMRYCEEVERSLTDLVVVASVGVGLWGARLLLEELFMADSRESSGLVDNRGSINPLVDGDGLVNGGGLDGFSLDNGLD